MAMVVPGPIVGVVVDSGLHLGRPRLLAVPMGMGVRLPAGVPVVAVPMGVVRLPAGAQLGAGAMAVAAGAGECRPSRGRLSVRAAANGSTGAGFFFFGSAASSVPLAAVSRAPANRASVVVAATASSPADGEGGEVFGDDSTPAEIDDEERRFNKEKEQFMRDGEKYILGWNPEEVLEQERIKKLMKDGAKYLVGWNPEEALADKGIKYQEWMLLSKEDEDGAPEEEVTPTFATTLTKDYVLKLVKDFNPTDVPTESFLICKEKKMIEFFGAELIFGASLLEQSMIIRPPTSKNYQALAKIGMELKFAAAECQRGYLQSVSLDRAVVAIQRLRATSLDLPEDCLERLDIKARLPRRPRRELGIDVNLQVMTYFILMAAYAHDVMVALHKDLYQRPATPGYY